MWKVQTCIQSLNFRVRQIEQMLHNVHIRAKDANKFAEIQALDNEEWLSRSQHSEDDDEEKWQEHISERSNKRVRKAVRKQWKKQQRKQRRQQRGKHRRKSEENNE